MWPEQLPEELLVEMLSRLPVQTLLRFRCVSKTWKSLIDSSTFVKWHLSQNPNSNIYLFQNVEYGSMGLPKINLSFVEVDLLNCSDRLLSHSLDLPLVPGRFKNRVVGSCDGLICISTHLFREFFLVNPSTREYRLLPAIIVREDYCHVGLGYDCGADEYKVVLIPEKGGEVHIFGSKSNTWRQINVSSKYNSILGSCDGKYTHGALHWIMGNCEHSTTMNSFQIVAFDLVSEKFTVAEYDGNLFGNPVDVLFEVLGGQLCLCCGYYVGEGDDDYMADIWVMEEYGVRESWSKLVSFDRFISPLAFSNCGRRLLVEVDRGWPSCSSLHWYDLDKKSMEYINNTCYASDYSVCLQSLIRLEHKLL